MEPSDWLLIVEERRRAFEQDASSERLRRRSALRHLAAASLRRLADRLEPLPALSHRSVAAGHRDSNAWL